MQILIANLSDLAMYLLPAWCWELHVDVFGLDQHLCQPRGNDIIDDV